MLLFSIFHVFFSHQHVQMITGPHEKKWCRNFFFLNKINFFKNYARPKDINLEFFYLYFQLPILYARISRMVNSKLKIKSQKRPTLLYSVPFERLIQARPTRLVCIGAWCLGVVSRPAKIANQCLYLLGVQKTTFGINKATRWLFRNSSLVITTGGSWEPSSGSYDAERHSLLDS